MNWLAFARDKTLEDHAGADTIDTMELDERLSELNDLIDEQTHDDDGNDIYETLTGDTKDEVDALREEREKLEGILNYVEGYGDRQNVLYLDGEPFIRHAQDFAEDIDAIHRNANWPANHIDWEAAAADLQQDYTSVEIEGRTYWFR